MPRIVLFCFQVVFKIAWGKAGVFRSGGGEASSLPPLDWILQCVGNVNKDMFVVPKFRLITFIVFFLLIHAGTVGRICLTW